MAAGMVASAGDVFSMPSNVFLERSELESKLASSFAGRVFVADGVLSEPIAMANLFINFAKLPSGDIPAFLSSRTIHVGRFRQFCVAVAQVKPPSNPYNRM